VRRSGRKRDDKLPIHMVSAFAARQRLMLGQRWSGCSLQRFASVKWIPCRLVA
jgi:hypothetical protein